MRKLNVFNFITLNGFYKGLNEDISWGHSGGEEESKFSEKGAQSGSTLLFGRVTYQMMEVFWPTPAAKESMPVVADGMNKAEKIVFSKTLKKSDWNNTKVINGDLINEVKKLKNIPGVGITILGSGSIVTQLADHNLIDQYQFMIHPVVIGEGGQILKGISHNLHLKLADHKVFKSGTVLLTYEAAKK